MLDARRRHDWEHTSAIMWIVAEVNRSKGRQLAVDHFNPYRRGGSGRAGIKVTPDNIGALKVFLPKSA
jgi:hypothetical protein